MCSINFNVAAQSERTDSARELGGGVWLDLAWLGGCSAAAFADADAVAVAVAD